MIIVYMDPEKGPMELPDADHQGRNGLEWLAYLWLCDPHQIKALRSSLAWGRSVVLGFHHLHTQAFFWPETDGLSSIQTKPPLTLNKMYCKTFRVKYSI